MADNRFRMEKLTVNHMDKIHQISGAVVLVDNSNIFIEGKKVAGKQVKKEQDPSWRLEYGNLVDKVLERSTLAHCAIFGSVPPPSDEVWRRAEARDRVTVDLTERSSLTGKEEKVDIRLGAPVSYELGLTDASKLKKLGRRYVIIGGDSDYSQVVRLAVEAGIRVDVYSWSSSLHLTYRALEMAHRSLVKVHLLDSIIKDISFREELTDAEKLQRARSRPNQTLVFMPSNEITARELREGLRSFHYHEMQVPSNLLFDPELQGGMDKVLLTFYYIMHPKTIKKLAEEAVEALNLDPKQVKKFWQETWEPLTLNTRARRTSQAAAAPEADDEGEWNLVIEAKAQRKKKRREQQLQQQTKRTVALSTRRCGHREFCQNAASFYAKGEGDGCGYRHTNGEQAFFKKHKQALRLLKTIACCNQNPEHKRRLQDPMCAFLHDGEEMLCKVCFHLPCLGGEECRAEGEMRPAVDSNSQHFKDLMKAGHIEWSSSRSRSKKESQPSRQLPARSSAAPEVIPKNEKNMSLADMEVAIARPGHLVIMDNPRALLGDGSLRMNYAMLRQQVGEPRGYFHVFGQFPPDVQLRLKNAGVGFDNISNPSGRRKEVAFRMGALLTWILARHRAVCRGFLPHESFGTNELTIVCPDQGILDIVRWLLEDGHDVQLLDWHNNVPECFMELGRTFTSPAASSTRLPEEAELEQTTGKGVLNIQYLDDFDNDRLNIWWNEMFADERRVREASVNLTKTWAFLEGRADLVRIEQEAKAFCRQKRLEHQTVFAYSTKTDQTVLLLTLLEDASERQLKDFTQEIQEHFLGVGLLNAHEVQEVMMNWIDLDGLLPEPGRAPRELQKPSMAEAHREARAAGRCLCKFFDTCVKGSRCTFYHVEAERELFRRHVPLVLHKVSECKHQNEHNAQYHWRRCPFLHKDEPVLCRACLHQPCLGPGRCETAWQHREVLYPGSQLQQLLDEKGLIKGK